MGHGLMRDLLRHRHPRLRGVLAQVPQRRRVPQGRRPDHGRRHDRQGDGPDRRPNGRLGARRSRSQRHVLADRGRGRGDGEADQRPRLLPGPPDARRAGRVGGRPGARRRPVQGRDARHRSSAGWRSPTSGSAGTGIRCVVSPANDDMFEIDPIIERAEHVELGEANTIALDGFTLVSTGWANPTPWNTFRELPEHELRERIDGLVAEVARPAPGDLQLPRAAVRLEPRQRARSSTPT